MERKKKFVKVRLNAAGERLIGIVPVPEPYVRMSDFLNSHDDFLLVKRERTDLAVSKDSISYIEALGEGGDGGGTTGAGVFHPLTLHLKDPHTTLEGEIFVPEGSDLHGTINKARRFLSLRSVRFSGTPEHYESLSIGKKEILFIEEITRLTQARRSETGKEE